jgi:hypothetical protein
VPRWARLHQVVSDREDLFFFCNRGEEKISPYRQEEIDNHPIQRGKGNHPEKEVGQAESGSRKTTARITLYDYGYGSKAKVQS